jgi:chaperonin GroEL (HSP60 family)
MKKRVTNAKIACLDINLTKARMQLGVQILVDDPSQLEEIRKRYGILIIYSGVSDRDYCTERPKSH